MAGRQAQVLKITVALTKEIVTQAYDLIIESDVSSDSDTDDDLLLAAIFKSELINEAPVRVKNYLDVIIQYSPPDFKKHFRLSRTTVEYLLQNIGDQLQNTKILGGRSTIELSTQVLAVLWLIGTPESYRSIAHRFDMGKASLHHCFVRFIHVVERLSEQVIKWPQLASYPEIARKFEAKANFPGVISAIDGTHISIKAPVEDEASYVNRHSYHSIVLQAICDDNLVFTNCFAGYPGSVHDARVFRLSDIFHSINERIVTMPPQYHILGDSAYPLIEWCLTPYKNNGHLLERQVRYNEKHAKTRQVIERAFSLLKNRYRRLKHLDMTRTDLIPKCIMACCVLHNICILQNDGIHEFLEIDEVQDTQNDAALARHNNAAGKLKRDQIAREL